MADIQSWSGTAANNVLSSGTVGTGGVNVDEGMAPDLVNNAMRDMMARITSWRTAGTALAGYWGSIVIGSASVLSIGSVNTFQLIGTTAANSGIVVGTFNTSASIYSSLQFYKSDNASAGSATVVANGDTLGEISFYGAQQTGTINNGTKAASITGQVDGTVTSGAAADMPGRLVFSTTPDSSGTSVERFRIDKTGLFDASQGTFAGFKFAATENPSSDVNTLDDYEEGTWTPSVTSSTGTITTVGTVSGWYRKIGGIVTVFADATITTNGTGAGYINIAGLPFTSTAAGAVNGKETATEKALAGFLSNGTTTLTHITFYDGTYPGANGNRFLVACSYPAA